MCRRLSRPDTHRRGILRAGWLILCALVLPLILPVGVLEIGGHLMRPPSASAQSAEDNPIVRENRLPGDNQWQRVGSRRHGDQTVSEAEASNADLWQPSAIMGYADRTSVGHGETIQFRVSTTARNFDLNIERMGWYDGNGGRSVYVEYGLPGLDQPIPAPDPVTGMVAADWQPSYSFTIPDDWTSGIFLVRLLANNDDRDVGYIVFVVRDDAQIADFVYKVSVNTYQAYNPWGGKSLYNEFSIDGRASKVSFDRPYFQWDGAGRFFEWDFPMIRWLEREGYNVTYITDVDAHADTAYMPGRRALLSVGHDEYWSQEMRDSWEAARDAGRSLAFFTANASYWQVRYEPSADGRDNRVLVCYKSASLDPLNGQDNSRVTVNWRSPPVNRPENAFIGIMWEGRFNFAGGFPYVVKAADHWIFEGTGAEPGQAWSDIVGYEYDRVSDNSATPPDLVVLAESPVVNSRNQTSVANSSYYRRGGMVFAAGTIHWAWGLDDIRIPGRVDPRAGDGQHPTRVRPGRAAGGIPNGRRLRTAGALRAAARRC